MNEYHVEISLNIQKEFKKLKKKNLPLLFAISKKVEEIRLNPQSYKNLNAPLNNLKRVHVGSSFVLLFSVNETTKTITLEYLKHHDDAY